MSLKLETDHSDSPRKR